jgi:hypothetical protein
MIIGQVQQFIKMASELVEGQYLKLVEKEFLSTKEKDGSISPDETTSLALQSLACISKHPYLVEQRQTLSQFFQAIENYGKIHSVSFATVFEMVKKKSLEDQYKQLQKEREIKNKDGEERSTLPAELVKIIAMYVADFSSVTPDNLDDFIGEIQGLVQGLSRSEIEAQQVWLELVTGIGAPKEKIAQCKSIDDMVLLVRREVVLPLITIYPKLPGGTVFMLFIRALDEFEQAKLIDHWIRTNPCAQSTKELTLSELELRHLPPAICALKQLTFLDLDDNQLRVLPAQISQLTELTQLCLGTNQLGEFPAQICQLQKLHTLDLNNNRLTVLPSEIQFLKQLKSLDVSDNLLQELPPEIGQLSALCSLYANNNQFQKITAQIALLQALKFLNISRNKLTELPSQIGDLKKLEKLYASGNQLGEVPPHIKLLLKD